MATGTTLDDVFCWLDQARGIIDCAAQELDSEKRAGRALISALYGASTLIERAQEIGEAEHSRLKAGGR